MIPTTLPKAVSLSLLGFLCLFLASCSPPPDSEEIEAMEEEPAPQAFSLESRGITLVYRDSAGRTQWQLYAESGETTLSEQGTYGTLRKVRLTLFTTRAENDSRESPYAVINAETGWAHQAVGTFLLEGNVHAKTVEGNFEITCQKIRGTPDTGVLEAEGDVNARFGTWILGPLQHAKAQFVSQELPPPPKAPPASPKPPLRDTSAPPSPPTPRPLSTTQPLRLYNLIAKSQTTWSFRSTDGNIEITGIEEGYSELQKDGSLRVLGSGSRLRAIWKQQNLTVAGSQVEGVFFPEEEPRTNTYRLESLEVKGGVTGRWTGTSEGKRWSLDLAGNSAMFSRSQGSMKIEGNVRVDSDHPTLMGRLTSQSATLTMDALALAQNRYEPDGLLAEGNVTYEMTVQAERPSRLVARDLRRLALKGKSTDDTLLASGEGNPFDVTLQSEGGTTATFKGHLFSATLSRKDARGQNWLLATAHFTSGVEMTTTGTLTRADGTSRPWTVKITCPEIQYEEATSTMELLGGVRVEGNHPVIGLSGGVAEGPRMVVLFEKGTFDPVRVRWTGNSPPSKSERRTSPPASLTRATPPMGSGSKVSSL